MKHAKRFQSLMLALSMTAAAVPSWAAETAAAATEYSKATGGTGGPMVNQLNLQAPATAIAADIYSLHNLMMVICLVIFVAVFGVMFYSILKHRKSLGHKSASFHESTAVEIAWTVVPFIIIILMALPATKVLVASNGGKALPENALITADGQMSGDPHTLYGDYAPVGPRNAAGGTGAIRAFGDHKGSGLAFMCELLAGALTGGGCSGPITERARIANGMLSIYLSPAHFADEAAFHQAAQDYIAWVKSCRPADPDASIMAPAAPENERRAQRRVTGLPLSRDAWQGILDTAASLGINGPQGI
eukprot:gene45848-56113_t